MFGPEVATRFLAWLESALLEARSETIVGFSINLYDSPFEAELVGASQFDPANPDWATEECWEPAQRCFPFPDDLDEVPWAARLEFVEGLLRSYLTGSSEAVEILKRAQGVAVGFVDGDLVLLHQR